MIYLHCIDSQKRTIHRYQPFSTQTNIQITYQKATPYITRNWHLSLFVAHPKLGLGVIRTKIFRSLCQTGTEIYTYKIDFEHIFQFLKGRTWTQTPFSTKPNFKPPEPRTSSEFASTLVRKIKVIVALHLHLAFT